MDTTLKPIILSLVLSFNLLGCEEGIDYQSLSDQTVNEEPNTVIYQQGAKVVTETPQGNSELPFYPLVLLDADQVCTGITFYNKDGNLIDGTRVCTGFNNTEATDPNLSPENIKAGVSIAGVEGTLALRPSDCVADGESNCVVDGLKAKAALLSNINSADIRTGISIAGISGSLSDCSADGGTGCIATASFPAANSTGAAAIIAAGDVLAGITGTAGIRPSDCSADGAIGCVAVTNFPAVDKLTKLSAANAAKIRDTLSIAGVSGTLADCSADGGSGCVIVGPAYAAAITSGAAAKIITGQTLAGISGSAAIRPADCAADGGTNCVAVTNFPAVDKVTNLAAGNLAKIHSSVTVAGVAGTLADCSSDNGTNCFAVTNYPSVVKANVTADVVKSGTVIAGVTGNYPSATYPLTGADGTADLDSTTFNAKVKSATAFEWFDSAGTRYTGAGDADITAANIKSGTDIFGTTGTSGPDCTADGQTSCLTTSTYKSVDTSAITAWDIRSGKTAGGIAGNLVFYKNLAKLSTFNRTAGTDANSSTTDADLYDTIDDYNNNGTIPNQAPPNWTSAPGSNWLRDSASDVGGGGGSASNGICDGTEDCVYKDQTTGLYWAKDDGTTRTWEAAIDYCSALSYGGYTDWRLPGQKEFAQAYIDGIWELKLKLNLSSSLYWTSTTASDSTTQAWRMYVKYGNVSYGTIKTSALPVTCVR